jgi:hypothetical protein
VSNSNCCPDAGAAVFVTGFPISEFSSPTGTLVSGVAWVIGGGASILFAYNLYILFVYVTYKIKIAVALEQ